MLAADLYPPPDYKSDGSRKTAGSQIRRERESSMRTIRDLIERLSKHNQVLGLIEFGSKRLFDDFATGDYDLLVIL